MGQKLTSFNCSITSIKPGFYFVNFDGWDASLELAD